MSLAEGKGLRWVCAIFAVKLHERYANPPYEEALLRRMANRPVHEEKRVAGPSAEAVLEVTMAQNSLSKD